MADDLGETAMVCARGRQPCLAYRLEREMLVLVHFPLTIAMTMEARPDHVSCERKAVIAADSS